MPNTSRINGFRVVKSQSGAMSAPATLMYVASAADEIFVGDIIKHGSTTDTYGNPTADLCGASDVPVGVCVGILHSKFNPAGAMNNGSTALDLPNAAQIASGAAGYILVNTDPHVIMECEASNGTPAATDVGLNASHANGSPRSSTVVTSPAYLDFGTETTTNTLNFQILGLVQRPDNEMGASAKLLVRFNVHQFNASTGTTGV